MALAIIPDMRKQHDNQNSSQFLTRPADYVNVLLILTVRVALLSLSQSRCTVEFEPVELHC